MHERFSILSETENKIITASVGFVSPIGNPDLFIGVRNKRGWDIPGGHVIGNENSLQAFTRELQEETGCLLEKARQIAILQEKKSLSTGMAVFRGFCSVQPFIPTEEIFERKFFQEDGLIKNYFGNKNLIIRLIKLCKLKYY